MKIIAPTQCPSCQSILERVNDQLFCRNSTECPAQSSKRLQNFCKKLKFKGFGESTLNKLEITSINELISLTPEQACSRGFSEHMANKLVNTVSERVEQGITANDFLAAMSIPLIGDGAMRKLKLESIETISHTLCKECGIGDKAANSLLGWIDKEWNNYKEHWNALLVQQEVAEAPSSNNIVVCITGKLLDFKNRKLASEFLTSKGFEVKSSITKSVDYLICEDGTQGSSYKKAVNYNIKITTIKELLEEI